MKNNIWNMVTIASLLLAMLATPAAAEITANLYVATPAEGGTSADYVRDETGIKLIGDGLALTGPDDLIQVIWDKSGDGITPPDPSDPSRCIDYTDDVFHDTFVAGETFEVDGTFFDVAWWPTSSTGGPYGNGTEVIYLRAWNAPTVDEATHYGDSIRLLAGQGTIDYDMLPSGTWWTTEPKPTPAPPCSFTKTLLPGWNLISLPLTPVDNSTGVVLNSLSGDYDTAMRYDAATHTFAEATIMDPGIGYFVHVSNDSGCTWTYGGEEYESINVSLSTGLNMIGWLNRSMDVSDALFSITGSYNYVARFNAATQSYETYAPSAPSFFNDFATMDPGEGYFIAAKAPATLTAPGYAILVDLTHAERVSIDGITSPNLDTSNNRIFDWDDWAAYMRGNDYRVDVFTTGPIASGTLDDYNVLIIAEPDVTTSGPAYFTTDECSAIGTFVGDGGGLLLMGTQFIGGNSMSEFMADYSTYYYYPEIHNALLSNMSVGMSFCEGMVGTDPYDVIVDETDGSGGPKGNIWLHAGVKTHPIWNDVTDGKFKYYHGCSINVTDGAIAGVATGDADTYTCVKNDLYTPKVKLEGSYPVAIAAADYGAGRIVAYGDAGCWQGTTPFGDVFTHTDNHHLRQIASNIMEYLCETS